MKKEKRILFIMGGLVHYYNPILEAINQLEGYELATLTPVTTSGSLGKGVHEEKNNLGFKTFFLPEKKGLLRKPFFSGFRQLIGRYQPDIIISGWPYSPELILNPFLRLRGIKLVHKDIPFNLPPYHLALKEYRSGNIIVSEDYEKSRPGDWRGIINYWLVTRLRKMFLSRADAHVCYTEEAYTLFPGYGVDREKIFVIYNSPDTSGLFSAAEKATELPDLLPANPHRIIHVGRLVKWKKVDLVLRAVDRIRTIIPDIEFLVVGDGPERGQLEQITSELGIENHVRFLGALYDPVILARYHQESAIYVLGGIGGLSINEAMCFGKPVICSQADGTERILVKEGRNGTYFKNDDVSDLSTKLAYLLNNPDLIAVFERESLRIIKEEVNETTVVEGYGRMLEFIS